MATGLPRSDPAHDDKACERLVDQELVITLVEEHHTFIWKLMAKLGIPEADVDDATQQVFMVLLQREGLLLKEGSERSFLFGVALKVARGHQRTLMRRREVVGNPVDEISDPRPSAERLADEKYARRLLSQILESMPWDLRVVFALHELDDKNSFEIAELLAIPRGTVATRLRRARDWFKEAVGKLQEYSEMRGAT